ALDNALHAAAVLLHGIARDGFRPPALGLIEGEADYGQTSMAQGFPETLSGIAMYQLERLLCESGAGRALITRDMGERLQAQRGTGWLNVAHGALSGKRFFALNPEMLKPLAPTDGLASSTANAASPSAGAGGDALRAGQRVDAR